jgi:hypothetical protein
MARIDVDALSADVVASAASDDPADRLRAAVVIADGLHGAADELLDRYVSAAREQERPWSEIGAALGISKQAAQQRFVVGPVDPNAWPKDFDDQARAIVPAAQVHARRLHHRYLGTEHLLLALADDTGLAGATLARLDIDTAKVNERVLQVVGVGHSGEASTLGISPRTKRVLEAAGQEARRAGHRCAIASPEHVLLALSAQHDAVAAEILRELGASDDQVRHTLAELLEGEAPEMAAKIREPPRRRMRRAVRWRNAA